MDRGRNASNLKELRKRSVNRLRDLRLPVPFGLQAFCQVVADSRRRAIVLQPVDGIGGSIMGAWIPTPDLDLIVYEGGTTKLHRDHIVLHELSHIICGHEPGLLEPGAAESLFPDFRPEVVRRTLLRHGYSSEDEIEAEVLASVISERVAALGSAEQQGEVEADDVMRRLEAFRQGESVT